MATAYAVLSACSHFRLLEENFEEFEKARAATETAICPDCLGFCGYVHIVHVTEKPSGSICVDDEFKG